MYVCMYIYIYIYTLVYTYTHMKSEPCLVGVGMHPALGLGGAGLQDLGLDCGPPND